MHHAAVERCYGGTALDGSTVDHPPAAVVPVPAARGLAEDDTLRDAAVVTLVSTFEVDPVERPDVEGGVLEVSLSMGHGLDRSDPSTHVDRSEILTCP